MLFKVGVLLILASCATIQKDIYFKSSNPKLGKVSDTGATPGHAIRLEGPAFPNGTSTTSLSVGNSANGIYLFGIIIPILPVFFLGNSEFELDPKENLRVHCNTWYFKRKTDNKQWYDRDLPCRSFQILAHGNRLSPVSSDGHGNFIFNIHAADLKNIIIENVTIEDGVGAIHTFPAKFEMKLENKIHYHMPNIAP